MRRIAYIPARSGSKGIPKKNIRPLCGKPLLGWMVEAAQKTGLFDRIMVSTDSEEFAEVARRCGAWVPFLRDPEVAKDTTPTIETICSDKRRLEKMGEEFETFCLLQATSPLCRPMDIAGAVRMFEEKKAGVVSLVRSKSRPFIMRTIDARGCAMPILAAQRVLRRQDEPVFYELNGAIYVNGWDELMPELKPSYNPYGYVMDEISSIDVDEQEDFDRAARYLKERIESLVAFSKCGDIPT
ncbi:MAG: acylneuraminate cytidylyltransferase family protein [Kiritimatiellae bacterium]|nr:acylneuraminate cytidylyltransferase family protein [Kiritimatiellia bacterium]